MWNVKDMLSLGWSPYSAMVVPALTLQLTLVDLASIINMYTLKSQHHLNVALKYFLCFISVPKPMCKKYFFEILGSITLNTLVVVFHCTHDISTENIS